MCLAFFSKRAAFWEPVPKRGAEGEITAAGAHSIGVIFPRFCFFLLWGFLVCLQFPYLSPDLALGHQDNSISLLHLSLLPIMPPSSN